MKKYCLSAAIFIGMVFSLQAQYTTPGTGIHWGLDDLVAVSAGIVTKQGDDYFIHDDLVITATDTIALLENAVLKFDAGVLITVSGVFVADPPDSILFTAMDTLAHYRSFRFEESGASLLKNCIVEYGGGVDILYSDMLVSGCVFRHNDQSNTTGTIDLFHASPEILACDFIYNTGPAVMSSANGESSPLIRDCYMYRNNAGNANMPQVNLGTSNPGGPIRIIGNHIEGYYINSGGIAVATLAGGSIDCIIDSNNIFNNRYGITVYGFNILSSISNNEIYDNTIENLPMQGGSGINIWGNISNTPKVYGNDIHGNLWGVTITGTALPDLGHVGPDSTCPGGNLITGNGNGGVLYALYNNTPNDMYAQNNYWGSYNLDSVEAVIFHQPDDAALGLVTYLPIMDSTAVVAESHQHRLPVHVFPNPFETYLVIENPFYSASYGPGRLVLRNETGSVVHEEMLADRRHRLELSWLPAGVYLLEVRQGDRVRVSKLIRQ